MEIHQGVVHIVTSGDIAEAKSDFGRTVDYVTSGIDSLRAGIRIRGGLGEGWQCEHREQKQSERRPAGLEFVFNVVSTKRTEG